MLENLPDDISRESVIGVFKNCGEIEDVEIVRNRDASKDSMKGIVNQRYKRVVTRNFKSREIADSGTYAFVTFANPTGKATALSDPLRILGTMIKGQDGQVHNCKTDDVFDKTVLLIQTGGLLNAEDSRSLLNPTMQQFGVVLKETSPAGVTSKDGRCLIEFGDHAMAVAAHKLLYKKSAANLDGVEVSFLKGSRNTAPRDYDPEHSSYFLSKPRKKSDALSDDEFAMFSPTGDGDDLFNHDMDVFETGFDENLHYTMDDW